MLDGDIRSLIMFRYLRANVLGLIELPGQGHGNVCQPLQDTAVAGDSWSNWALQTLMWVIFGIIPAWNGRSLLLNNEFF
jgi:hypothetical protein